MLANCVFWLSAQMFASKLLTEMTQSGSISVKSMNSTQHKDNPLLLIRKWTNYPTHFHPNLLCISFLFFSNKLNSIDFKNKTYDLSAKSQCNSKSFTKALDIIAQQFLRTRSPILYFNHFQWLKIYFVFLLSTTSNFVVVAVCLVST